VKRIRADGAVEFRPTLARASLPLGITAVLVPAATGVLCRLDFLPLWMLFTALAGSLFVFATSFVMPWLQAVSVQHGVISGPSGHGINTLRLERIDHDRSCVSETGEARLVDDLGSTLVLSPLLLDPEEIHEAWSCSVWTRRSCNGRGSRPGEPCPFLDV
jgi:hypothetical protein